MNFNITTEAISNIKSDLEIILVVEKDLKHTFVEDKKLLKKQDFRVHRMNYAFS